jgi:cytochrome P450
VLRSSIGWTNHIETVFVYLASSDTVCERAVYCECSNCPSHQTVSAAGIFLYLMAKNPRVQWKAQEEIDRVIGSGRLPDVNDRPDLPYIEAIYRELLRYEPPLGIGIPHSLVEDDVIDGYFLPKGSSSMAVLELILIKPC